MIGVHLVDKEIGTNCDLFSFFSINCGKIEFQDWYYNSSVLVGGIKNEAHNVVLHDLFMYQSIEYADTIVVGVQFLEHGGVSLAQYDMAA